MKRLTSLKMSEFIDISCGNYSSIVEEGDNVTPEEIKHRAERLFLEYKMIIDPVGMKMLIAQQKQSAIRTARIYICNICVFLLETGSVSAAKDILRDIDWKCGNSDVDTLINKLRSEQRRLEFEESRMSAKAEESAELQKEPTADEIRAMFDKEQASLMTYFKMNISMDSITASVYANMVAQAAFEIKMKKKALASAK